MNRIGWGEIAPTATPIKENERTHVSQKNGTVIARSGAVSGGEPAEEAHGLS
ncbi:hypothetical protein [Brevibacillus fluminis]|uniref:hypothetical protein n=1 Tax=Brevibacillus fluminis TaxID=511487 RepID=UPI001605A21E|nr:hypothetical protein [Brevibacillus fluminis]